MIHGGIASRSGFSSLAQIKPLLRALMWPDIRKEAGRETENANVMTPRREKGHQMKFPPVPFPPSSFLDCLLISRRSCKRSLSFLFPLIALG